jgi:hypothetical protein
VGVSVRLSSLASAKSALKSWSWAVVVSVEPTREAASAAPATYRNRDNISAWSSPGRRVMLKGWPFGPTPVVWVEWSMTEGREGRGVGEVLTMVRGVDGGGGGGEEAWPHIERRRGSVVRLTDDARGRSSDNSKRGSMLSTNGSGGIKDRGRVGGCDGGEPNIPERLFVLEPLRREFRRVCRRDKSGLEDALLGAGI